MSKEYQREYTAYEDGEYRIDITTTDFKLYLTIKKYAEGMIEQAEAEDGDSNE